MQRVITYIDGFNCYFGLKESGWKRYYWLDYQKLSERLTVNLKADSATLVATKYFTSRISYPNDKRKRQSDFLEALELKKVQLYFGNYKDKKIDCSGCGRPNFHPTEKQTDVNIAVQMLIDAYEDKFDTAMLIGGDSDLVPPVREIRRLFPTKRVIAVFPPKRISKEIKNVCNGVFHLNEVDLKNNLLPPTIEKPDGYILKQPESWR